MKKMNQATKNNSLSTQDIIAQQQQDIMFMQCALDMAYLAKNNNEVPVGAVIVKDNKIIAKAHNNTINTNNPCAHAEIQVLIEAGKIIGNYRLIDTTLYVTVEPCAMCFAAMNHARIKTLVFGALQPRMGAVYSALNLATSKHWNHVIEIRHGVLREIAGNVLIDFFMEKRSGNNS